MYNLKVKGQINADDIKLKVQKEPITNPPEYEEKELALKDDLIDLTVIENYIYSDDVVMFSNYNTNLRAVNWKSSCYGNNKFIAVGVKTSTTTYNCFICDLPLFTNQRTVNIAASDNYYGICFGNNTFVAVGNSTIAYSTDGLTWYTKTVGTIDWHGICFGNNTFVAVAYNSTKSMISSDGITWNENNISAVSDNWVSVCFGGNKFLTCAENSKQIAFSTNGINWTTTFGPPEIYPSITSGGADTVCYGNNTFIGLKSSYLIYSNIQYKKKLIYSEKMNEIATLFGEFFYPIGSCYRNFYHVNPSEELGFGEWIPVSDSVSMNTGYINNVDDPNFVWMRIK